MKVAIVGSRGLDIEIPEKLIPKNASLIISGGAVGIDRKARDFAYEKGIKIIEILPEYDLYGRKAPLLRNDVIIEQSDAVVVFWDGKSRGSEYVIRKCRQLHKRVDVYLVNDKGDIERMPEQIFF